jgi:transposase
MSTTTRQAAVKQINVGSWRRDFAGLEQRRLEAARMFAQGATQAEVARTFGVSPQAASIWYRRWRQGGEAALRAAGRAGRRPRLSAAELDAVEGALRKGPAAFGFDTDLWTLARVAQVIQRLTGVGYHPGHVWRLLRRLGWSVQRPARRASERDDAEIARWRAEEWPRIKGGALRRGAWLWFLDESGCSLRPPVRRTWAPGGQTPILRHRGHWKRASMAGSCCYAPGGSRARLWFHTQPDSYNDHTLIVVLKQLRRFLRGAPARLIWDNLPAHHSRVMGPGWPFRATGSRSSTCPAMPTTWTRWRG